MPFDGFSQKDYALKMIDAYTQASRRAGAGLVRSRSTSMTCSPGSRSGRSSGNRPVYLDDSYDIEGWSPMDESTWTDSMASLRERGVNYIRPAHVRCW